MMGVTGRFGDAAGCACTSGGIASSRWMTCSSSPPLTGLWSCTHCSSATRRKVSVDMSPVRMMTGIWR